MASIHDVAREAGVSVATVSRTFRTPDLLNEHTQQRVLDVAQQLGYRPRSVRARSAKPQRTAPTVAGLIGFQFFADIPQEVLTSNTFYAPMLAGAQSEAAALGLHLLVHTTDRSSLGQGLPRMVEEQLIEGMLLVGTAERALLDAFVQQVPHVILVDNRDETGAFESVVSDGFGGALAATRHLIGLGHRRIAFFQARAHIATFQDRLHGYWCALREAGLPGDPDRILEARMRDEDWSEALSDRLHALMCGHDRPTALLTANDDCAQFAQQICRRAGLSVPNDISLVGFDDMPFTAYSDPPLTTVRVDKEEMGRLAVRRLHTRLQAAAKGRPAPAPVQNVVPVSLVVRESCRPLTVDY